jgi:hypothetical protein
VWPLALKGSFGLARCCSIRRAGDQCYVAPPAGMDGAEDATLSPVTGEPPQGQVRPPTSRLNEVSKREESVMLQRLHHVAYRCLDAAVTVDFYILTLSA